VLRSAIEATFDGGIQAMLGFVRGFLRRAFQFPNHLASRRRRNNDAAAAPHFESLEDRRLLAVSGITYDALNMRVNVIGTSGADEAVVSSSVPGIITVRLQSSEGVQSANFATGAVSLVAFYGLEGNDRFENQTSVASRAGGNEGND
jgi:hypothetical protein